MKKIKNSIFLRDLRDTDSQRADISIYLVIGR